MIQGQHRYFEALAHEFHRQREGGMTFATCFCAQEDIDCFRGGGEAGCYVGYEGGAFLACALREGLLDMFHDEENKSSENVRFL